MAPHRAGYRNYCTRTITPRKCGDYPCYDERHGEDIRCFVGPTNRRTFITALGSAAAWPLLAHGQLILLKVVLDLDQPSSKLFAFENK